MLGPLPDVCTTHSRVIPAESYTALDDSDERLREITLLQQKAKSLEAEVTEHKKAEERLRSVSRRRGWRLSPPPALKTNFSPPFRTN